MKLHEFAFSPNCRKVRAVAYELGIELERHTINLIDGTQRTPAYRATKNPNGRVPVLEDGDFLLWESNAIILYLATQYGGGKLVPTAPRERAEVDRWLSWQLAHLGPAISKVAYERIVKKLTGRGAPDQALIDAGTAEFAELTKTLDAALEGRDFVAGALSVADFALASHYSIAPTCGLDVTPYKRAGAWLERMSTRPSMKRAIDEARASM